MGIFSKTVTSKEIGEKISRFAEGTRQLESELSEAQTKVALALARGTEAQKEIKAAAELRVAIDSRPMALAALQREERRAVRAEGVAGQERSIKEVASWAEKMETAGADIVSALGQLIQTIDTWRGTVTAGPAVAGPTGDFDSRDSWTQALRLHGLQQPLAEFLKGLSDPEAILTAMADALVVVRTQATITTEERLAKLAGEERRDAEVVPASAEFPIAAVG